MYFIAKQSPECILFTYIPTILIFFDFIYFLGFFITVAKHGLSGSLDSSRDLQPIHTKSFVNRLHLVHHACVETFDVTFFFCVYGFMGWELNSA